MSGASVRPSRQAPAQFLTGRQAAAGDSDRYTTPISSTELAARTGINRSTVRAALRELRGKLGLAQDDDLVAAARATGLLAGGESDRR